jgi:hypothetical protein
MPAAEIATGDADARSVNADRIENTLNNLSNIRREDNHF